MPQLGQESWGVGEVEAGELEKEDEPASLADADPVAGDGGGYKAEGDLDGGAVDKRGDFEGRIAVDTAALGPGDGAKRNVSGSLARRFAGA